MDMLGHDRCNTVPLCEWKGIFLSWCSTTQSLCRQQPQVFPCLSTPTSIVSKPQRRADWRVKTKLLSQIPISNVPFVPTQQADERLNLGNLTCRPEVTIHVSFAHHWGYCSFLREIGEGAVGHECCHNARRCKECGLAIKGNPLYFFKFFRWLTCFCALCGLCKTWLKFRHNLQSFVSLIIQHESGSKFTPPEP